MAITTAAFPDRHITQRRKVLHRPYPKGDCTICLESLSTGPLAVLPCRHILHRRCLCALSGNPTTGSSSMVRCPCCRQCLPLSRQVRPFTRDGRGVKKHWIDTIS